MSRPLVCLTMILKNEAHCIQRTLDSVKEFVDCWTILDTGSIDGTQVLVQEIMRNVPGRLHEEPFIDFSTSRNRVLHLAKTTSDSVPVFTLMLSADETFSGGPELRNFLDSQRGLEDGAYSIIMSAENSRWFYPRVLRVDANWTYVGEVHEVPLGPNRETHGVLIPGVVVSHEATDPERRSKRLREFDLPMLTKMVEDETRPLIDRAQAVWFLAQTYEGLADGMKRDTGSTWITYKMNAMSFYWRRVEMGNSMGDENDSFKTHYALFRFMNIAEKIGFYTDEEMLTRLNGLVGIEPRIPELHYMIAVHAAKLDVRQGLFFAEQAARVARKTAEEMVYHLPVDVRLEWLALAVAAGCAKQLERFAYAKELAERALAVGGPRSFFEEFLSLKENFDTRNEFVAAEKSLISISEDTVLKAADTENGAD